MRALRLLLPVFLASCASTSARHAEVVKQRDEIRKQRNRWLREHNCVWMTRPFEVVPASAVPVPKVESYQKGLDQLFRAVMVVNEGYGTSPPVPYQEQVFAAFTAVQTEFPMVSVRNERSKALILKAGEKEGALLVAGMQYFVDVAWTLRDGLNFVRTALDAQKVSYDETRLPLLAAEGFLRAVDPQARMYLPGTWRMLPETAPDAGVARPGPTSVWLCPDQTLFQLRAPPPDDA